MTFKVLTKTFDEKKFIMHTNKFVALRVDPV